MVSQGPEDDRIRVEFNWLNPSQKFRYKFDRKGAIRFGSQILKARACITLHLSPEEERSKMLYEDRNF